MVQVRREENILFEGHDGMGKDFCLFSKLVQKDENGKLKDGSGRGRFIECRSWRLEVEKKIGEHFVELRLNF